MSAYADFCADLNAARERNAREDWGTGNPQWTSVRTPCKVTTEAELDVFSTLELSTSVGKVQDGVELCVDEIKPVTRHGYLSETQYYGHICSPSKGWIQLGKGMTHPPTELGTIAVTLNVTEANHSKVCIQCINIAGDELAFLQLQPRQNAAELFSTISSILDTHIEALRIIRADGKLMQRSNTQGTVALELGLEGQCIEPPTSVGHRDLSSRIPCPCRIS
eukprot:TRINITY_DN18548_c0_g1_i2.p1 TRINITY_DN18548_c0_g1~~TRINITY_DN18548_c0_g1_i2.p1  ORF type:complete len:221 (+),score=14.08 TRINITY_DN18548_c0_g1_i2:62-724(+)